MSSIWDVRRSRTDAKVAGLCGGVAEHWGVDPVLVRVAWVLLALSGGVGVVLYLAGWLLVPQQGRQTAASHDLLGGSTRSWSREVWVVLVVVACLVVFPLVSKATKVGVGPLLVIAAIWYFGYHRRRPAAPDPATGALAGTSLGSDAPGAAAAAPQFVQHIGPPTPFTAAAQAWRQRIEQHVQQHPAPGSPGPAAAAVPPASTTPAGWDPDLAHRTAFLAQPDPVGLYAPEPVPPAALVRSRDRVAARRLRLVCLAVLGLVLSGLALADRAGVHVPAVVPAAAALLVVGLTLVAATWCGRARGLLPLGLLLLPVVLVTSVLPPVDQLQQSGSQQRQYLTAAALPRDGDLQQTGQLEVDLSGLDLQQDASYSAHVGSGRLEVVVPPDTNVALRYDVGLGVVQAYDQRVEAGTDLVSTLTPTAVAGRPTLTLDLSVDRGQLEVRS